MNSLSNTQVLVIDDSFVNRQFIKAILEENHMNVIEAGDGTEALDILVSHKPDLIILDLLMPVMDGIEALQKIRMLGFKVPILILTADIHDSTREKCEKLGVSGFIKKPTNYKELMKHILNVFQTKPY